MSTVHYSRLQISEFFSPGSWEGVLFSEFTASLTSEARPFPCIFGVNGFKADQLRFAFCDPFNAESISLILDDYIIKARSYGPNTSLVLFARPGPVMSLDRYRRRFWQILRELSRLDRIPWPESIPESINHPKWEFCFAGEPIFVVCNTPAHVQRQSRRSTSFMMTFQPRWVFEKILGTEKAHAISTGKVRERLKHFDLIEASPELGRYGDPKNREFAQYFLGDDNGRTVCPFHALNASKKEEVA